jgi:quercetin dioxygenase-like cupin family protein
MFAMSFVEPEQGVRFELRPGEVMTWMATEGTTKGAYDLVDLRVDSGVRSTLHKHYAHDEAFYVLDGKFRMRFGSEIIEAMQGSFLFVPRGTPHAWLNEDNEPGRVLLIFTPGGMSEFFLGMNSLSPAIRSVGGDLSKLDREVSERMAALAKQFEYETLERPWSGR